MIRFLCPQCHSKFEVEDKLGGRNGFCKNCNTRYIIPLLQATEPAQAASVSASAPASRDKIVISLDEIAPTSKPAIVVTVNSEPARPLSPRMRRLQADAETINLRFKSFPLIRLLKTAGSPPETYTVEYFIRGVEQVDGRNIKYRDNHVAEFQLTSEYPRTAPKCRMLTPIFHPNIVPSYICIGDHWTAQERLSDLIIRVGEMIGYQSYNVKSPLDGGAAMWADLNHNIFPIDKRDLEPPE